MVWVEGCCAVGVEDGGHPAELWGVFVGEACVVFVGLAGSDSNRA